MPSSKAVRAHSPFPSADAAWVTETILLRFKLGEIPLFDVRLPLLVQESHFTRLAANPELTEMPMKNVPESLEGFLVRSQPVGAVVPRIQLRADEIRYISAQYEHYFIEVKGSFSEYLEKFSSKSRWTLQHKVQKFAAFSGGRAEWRAYRTPAEMEEFYPLARSVSVSTYQERYLDCGLPASESFQKRMQELAGKDSARAYLLFHRSNPIAYLYCPLVEKRIQQYGFAGYNPTYGAWSPGTVLLYLALEKIFAEREIEMFDFTEGEAEHKRFLSTGSIHCADTFHFRRTLRGGLLVILHAVLSSTSRLAARILGRLKLRGHIKQLLRWRAAPGRR